MMFPADDPVTDDPRPTALFSAAASAASANSWTSVNGWSVARVYSSVPDEYLAAHAEAAVADIGPVVRCTVRGADAAAFLQRIVSAPIGALEPGESVRGLMIDDDGFVIDLAEAARLAADLYLLSTSRKHARRLQLGARGLDAAVEEITEHVAAMAIIGPASREAAAAAGFDLMSDKLAAQSRVRGVELSVRPVAYGALPAVEVIFPFDEALTLWERLRRAAKPKPIGLDALEIIRIEGGTPRLGVDFQSSETATSADQKRTPASLGLAHLAPLARSWFSGRRALREAGPPHRRLIGLGIDADRAQPGAQIYGKKGAPVGRVTSCAFSPRMKRVVAFADIAAEAAGEALEVDAEGTGRGTGSGRAPAGLLETAESRAAAASGGP
ncbi:MAG: aminomethyl transferase family protein [Parvularculaceae bacterium]|jgi:glycine cleavage system aminomethyltransferase T|nr:aminomethyl transferase family protein [Parvularculaceae bacterium]